MVLHEDEETEISALLHCGKDYQSCETDIFTTGEGTSDTLHIQASEVAIGHLCPLMKRGFHKLKPASKGGNGVLYLEGQFGH